MNNNTIQIPKGISNIGNTCYFNSCVQIFSRIIPLKKIILDENIKKNEMEIYLNIWNNFKDIIKLLETTSIKRETVLPNGILNSLMVVSKNKKKSFFINKEEEDITEFISFFIECLHNSINNPVEVQISGVSKNTRDDTAIEVYKMLKNVYEKDYSSIQSLFEGISVYTINDDKEKYSTSAEIFYNLILHIPKKENKSVDIYNCIEHKLKSEKMVGDNKWFNDKTNTYMEVLKETKIWKFPEVLLIMLSRFNYDGSKNNDIVEFYETIDLTKYVEGYKKDSYYELIGVCNHIQTSLIGHYTCFFKQDGNWFHSNDEIVQKVEEFKHIVSKHAYCLFYVKKNKNL